MQQVRLLLMLSGALLRVTSTSAQSADSFDPEPNNSVGALAVQADGRILVGGHFTTLDGQQQGRIGRLNADGTLDGTFDSLASDIVYCLAIQLDGKILLGGGFTSLNGQTCSHIGRLNTDGSLDTEFGGTANGTVHSLAMQADGKIVVGGTFTSLNYQPLSYVGRLNPDGTLDSNFNAQVGDKVLSLALQPDGSVLVAGSFTSVGGQPCNYVGRLNPDGSLDASFNPGANNIVQVVAVQADGKILVGGNFTRLRGQARYYVGRLNSDGSLDDAFNPGANSGVYTLVVQADGKILVGGSFTALGGQTRNCIGRLNADGTLDGSFNPGDPGVPAGVSGLAVQGDGRILVGGAFTNLGGQSRANLGRLNNTDTATEALGFDGSKITWNRGGAAPELGRTSFDGSTNGVDWINLGVGVRVPGGWELGNLSFPRNAAIRARGHTVGGYKNGSAWFVESFLPTIPLQTIVSDGSFGFISNRFGFNMTGPAGQSAIVEASTDLLSWVPLETNAFTSEPLYFSDPSTSANPRRFYRLRVP